MNIPLKTVAKSSREKYAWALAICKLEAGGSMWGLIAKLAWLCLIQTLHRNSRPAHTPGPEYNPPFVQPEQSVQDLASQRRTNTFRRLLFGLCNWHGSPGCVRDERFVCECRTNRQSTSSLVQLPLSCNFRNWESLKHQKPILGMWAHLLLLQASNSHS